MVPIKQIRKKFIGYLTLDIETRYLNGGNKTELSRKQGISLRHFGNSHESQINTETSGQKSRVDQTIIYQVLNETIREKVL